MSENGVEEKSCENACFFRKCTNCVCTGKSLSEALIFVSTNPHYGKRLFIELQVKHMKIPNSEHVVYTNWVFCFCFDIQNNLCTQHVLSL